MNTNLIPTEEQEAIIDAIMCGKNIKVIAKAGASKSTTLMMAANRIESRILYLAFNRNVVEEFKEKFNNNAEIRTTHSLAFASFGRAISHKLSRPKGGYKNVCGTGLEVANYFKIDDMLHDTGMIIKRSAIGLAIVDTVNNFENSSSEEITNPDLSILYELNIEPSSKVGQEFYTCVLEHSKKLWELRKDATSEILATHNTYLKLFQLSKPVLDYDVIMVDEFQDSNSCVIDIIKNQSCQIVLVGDPHQQIYQFRGSINALERFDIDTYYLTKSFRFGQEIAEVGKKIIKEDKFNGNENLITTLNDVDLDLGNDEITYIYRTNIELIKDAVVLITKGREVNLMVDISGTIDLLFSLLFLRKNEVSKVKHRALLAYNSWEHLYENRDYVPKEIRMGINIILQGEASNIINVLKNHKADYSQNITMITAHKAKGLEWDNVVLGKDFDEYDKNGEVNELERNLLYVAATRAKKNLITNPVLDKVLGNLKEG